MYTGFDIYLITFHLKYFGILCEWLMRYIKVNHGIPCTNYDLKVFINFYKADNNFLQPFSMYKYLQLLCGNWTTFTCSHHSQHKVSAVWSDT